MKREKMTIMMIKVGAFILLLIVMDWIFIRSVGQRVVVPIEGLRVYSTQDLSIYSGEKADEPILLAMDGFVYDVSSGRDDFYGPGQPYHDLAGKDASIPLQLFGASIIRGKYKVVGVHQP